MHYEQLDDHAHKSPGRGVRHRGNPTRAADAHENLEGKCNVQSAMQRRGKERGGSVHDLLEEGGVQRGKHANERVLKERRTTGESCVCGAEERKTMN